MEQYLVNITTVIETEVERRVNERVTSLLEYMSETCDIPLSVLTKLMLRVEKKQQLTCLATNKKNSRRCRNSPKENGYCHLHQNRYVPKTPPPAPKKSVPTAHTHTLPPLYMAGCPACERKPVDVVDDDDELKFMDAFT